MSRPEAVVITRRKTLHHGAVLQGGAVAWACAHKHRVFERAWSCGAAAAKRRPWDKCYMPDKHHVRCRCRVGAIVWFAGEPKPVSP